MVKSPAWWANRVWENLDCSSSFLPWSYRPSTQRSLVLETFSVSHGKAYPYLPLIDLLKNYFQLGLHDDERIRREKITGRVLTLDRSLEDILPYLFFLLGIAEPTSPLQQMDAQIRRRRILDAIKRLLLRESLNQPLILVFEDLHWLDAETQTFLTLLSESIPTARILLLVNYRPEYRHDWSNKGYYTQLRLDPLGREQAEEMLTVLLGDVEAQHAAPLRQFILDKTEGNPFFMEEIVQELREQGILTDPRRVGIAHQYVDLRLPTTVQGILAARMDRLPPDEKGLLQTLAVIGREFSASLLKRVVDATRNRTSTASLPISRQQSSFTNSLLFLMWSTFSNMPSPKKSLTTPCYKSDAKSSTNALHERLKKSITQA